MEEIRFAPFMVAVIFAITINVQARSVVVKSGYPISELFTEDNTSYIIRKTIDLKGQSVNLPDKAVLTFKGKGKIVNGKLVGNDSRIEGRGKRFVGVVCEGTWNMPDISDVVFDREVLSDNQVLKNIENLQSDYVDNVITLMGPDYFISIDEKNGYGLRLKSHVTLDNRTSIWLRPNSWSQYDIIQVAKTTDVSIRGGRIIGDVDKHIFVEGKLSAWGHGINVSAATDVVIENVKIERCMGDGIAITGMQEKRLGEYQYASRNVLVRNCVMDNNRRQGMSIIHAENMVVDGCTFSNTGAIATTPPSAGLDIEPNANEKYRQGVRNVRVSNCHAFGNVGGGIKIQGHWVEDGQHSIDNVVIEKCNSDGSIDVASDGVVVRNCRMKSSIVRGSRDEIKMMVFEDCVWEKGSGVLVYYSGYTNEKGVREGGMIDSLIIRRGKIVVEDNQPDTFYKGAIAFHGGVGGVNHLTCEDSEIVIPSSVGEKFNLTKSNNIPDLRFIHCSISMPERQLYTRGAKFTNCTIECKSVDIKEDEVNYNASFIGSTIILKD